MKSYFNYNRQHKLPENIFEVEADNETIVVEVYNLTGRLMLQGNTKNISLQGLPTGAYLISVTIDGNRETKVTVVQ